VITMLTCKRAHTLIVRTIDDETLSGEARALLRQHLGWCVSCRDEYETQHEVRRLLALQIECKPPAGFAERLNGRLAQEPNREPASQELGTQAPAAPCGWWEVASVWRRDMRWRTGGLRLLPAAATLALIVAGTYVRDLAPPLASPSVAAPVASSLETEVTVPPRPHAPPRLRGREPLSTGVLFGSPAKAKAAVDRQNGSNAAIVEADAVGEVTPTSPTAVPLPAQPIELSAIAPRLAPELADELRLSDAQRKQIDAIYDMRQHALHEILESTRQRVELERYQTDAAIEHVLTPEQRKQYRERRASEGSGIPTRPAAPLPPADLPMPPRLASPDRSGPPF
jgi:hypothetical protein